METTINVTIEGLGEPITLRIPASYDEPLNPTGARELGVIIGEALTDVLTAQAATA